jgi:hypothetical protein
MSTSTSGKSKVGVGVILGVKVIVGVWVIVEVFVRVGVVVLVAVGTGVGVNEAVGLGVKVAFVVIVGEDVGEVGVNNWLEQPEMNVKPIIKTAKRMIEGRIPACFNGLIFSIC